MIFSSDISAWVSLLLAVAGWEQRERCMRKIWEQGDWEHWKQDTLCFRQTAQWPVSWNLNQAGNQTKAQWALWALWAHRNMGLVSQYLTALQGWGSPAAQTKYAHGCCLCFYIMCLTFQHFHCHFCAGLGMRETVRSCLDYPAKCSWSKSATWNTKKGSVGQSVKGAHIRPEKVERTLLFIIISVWAVFYSGIVKLVYSRL